MNVPPIVVDFWQVIVPIAVFLVVLLASNRVGRFFTFFRLPLITGFLVAGLLMGPDILGLLTRPAVESLYFVNQIALAVIALAAGNELRLKEYRDRFRSITCVTIFQLLTLLGGTSGMYLLTSYVPVMADLPVVSRFAISALAGIILVARSPSSAIAIVSELRAKGPVTHTIFGVTVIMDVIVIILFAVGVEFAHAVVEETPFTFGFVAFLLLELGLSLVFAVLLWKCIVFILRIPMRVVIKSIIIILVGFAVFVLAEGLAEWSMHYWSKKIFVEPLLICMVAGILVTNFSTYRDEFSAILHRAGPPVYLAFFTLTGASLEILVLSKTWQIAILLVLIRMVTIFLGSLVGGKIAGDAPRHNWIGWMGYITQAGVGIGLAGEISRQSDFFPWGPELATILLAAIIINQLIGPPLLKWAISLAGESRLPAAGHAYDGMRKAIILGHKTRQPLLLAERLLLHAWEIMLVVVDGDLDEEIDRQGITVVTVADLSEDSLGSLELDHGSVLISLLTDEENLQVCELNYEKYGIEKVVVLLEDSITYGSQCHDLGALVLDPKTSMVSLLEHCVTSPTATSILLGLDPEQEVEEMTVLDSVFNGMPIRDLKIPHTVTILSVTRDGHTLVSQGYITLQLGDQLTVMGPPEVLPYVAIYFDR